MGKQVLSYLRYLVLTTLGLNMFACETPTAGPPQEVRPGDVFRIIHPLEIPVNRYGIVLQHGQPSDEATRDYYAAHCQFASKNMNSVITAVTPGTFVIRQVTQRTEPGADPTAPGGQPGSQYLNYVTELSLTSSSRSELQSIICQHRDQRIGGQYLTLEEINEALGAAARVEVLDKKQKLEGN